MHAWEWSRVYPRGARWYVDYVVEGRRHRKSLGKHVTTRRQAEIALREIVVQKERAPGVGGLVVALGEALADFVASKRSKREKRTADTYERHARVFEEHLGETTPVTSITPRAIERFLAQRVKDGIAKTTANKERTALGTFFKRCVRLGFLSANPVDAVEPFSVRPVKKRPASRAEVAAFLRALRRGRERQRTSAAQASFDAHMRALYADVLRVIWHMGVRAGEVCAWTRADVSLSDWSIVVRSAENKGGQRVLPIAGPARRIIARRAAREEAALFSGPPGCAEGAYGQLYHFRSMWLKQHPEHRAANFHLLRHRYAARAEGANVDPVVRSKGLLGHATVQMTTHYSSRELEQLRRAQEQIATSERAARVAERTPKG